MNHKAELQFFDGFYQALSQENQTLHSLFDQNHTLYRTQHHGICCLYETTMVYLVMKELLRQKFPYTLFWEYPYPDNSSWKADLGILDPDSQEPVSLVEFKIWLSNSGREVLLDVEKLNSVPSHLSKYLCVVEYGGDANKNAAYLEQQSECIHVIAAKTFSTRFYDSELGQLKDIPINLYFLRLNEEP